MTIEEARKIFVEKVTRAARGDSFYLSNLLKTDTELQEAWNLHSSRNDSEGGFDVIDAFEDAEFDRYLEVSFKYDENGPKYLADEDYIIGVQSFIEYVDMNPYDSQFCKFCSSYFDDYGYITTEAGTQCKQLFALIDKIEKSIYNDVAGSIDEVEDLILLLRDLLNKETRIKLIPYSAKFLSICQSIKNEDFTEKELDDFVEIYCGEVLSAVADLRNFVDQYVQQCPLDLLFW